MPAPKQVLNLINTFARNIDAYKTGRYNETQLRREYIDPFFTALGWDEIAAIFSRNKQTVSRGINIIPEEVKRAHHGG